MRKLLHREGPIHLGELPAQIGFQAAQVELFAGPYRLRVGAVLAHRLLLVTSLQAARASTQLGLDPRWVPSRLQAPFASFGLCDGTVKLTELLPDRPGSGFPTRAAPERGIS